MPKLKRSQIRLLEEAMAFPNGWGYVLDFSDRTIAEFFEDEFRIDIDDPKFSENGTSKRNRLTTLITLADGATGASILRALWERREGLLSRRVGVQEPQFDISKEDFLKLIGYVETGTDVINTDALEPFARDRTLDELIRDIERDLQANKPEAAMDHLHTYCMKKFAHLLSTRGITCGDNEALHARVGKYRKAIADERDLSDFTDRALKSAISLFDAFNDIRNNKSFAHDNIILEPEEARYVYEQIRAMLIFIRAVEAGRYEE